MNNSFYIVDDDIAIRRIVKKIISENFPHSTVYQSDDPIFALKDMISIKPDIAIIDVLMEGMDGLELCAELRKHGFNGRIIMLSEVTSKEIVGNAYTNDIDFYITKPVNVTEIISVIRRTIENLQLKVYNDYFKLPEKSPQVEQDKRTEKLAGIYKDLGIIGDQGIDELTRICLDVQQMKINNPSTSYTLFELYEKLRNEQDPSSKISIKGIEQRLRRLVTSAMENLVNLGLEDFSNYKFEKYSTSLFNFKSVKQEMDYVRGRSNYRGKIDIKTFIDGLVSFLN